MEELDFRVRIIKNISHSDAERLRKASVPIEFIRKSDSSLYLYEDMNQDFVLNKNQVLPKKGHPFTLSYKKDLGSSEISKYDFEENNDCDGTILEIGSKDKKYKSMPCELSFCLLQSGNNRAFPGSFDIEIDLDPEDDNPDLNYGAYFGLHISKNYNRSNYLYGTAVYFYNKYKIYEKIKDYLIECRQKIVEDIKNEIFVDDIIELFSAKKAEEASIKISSTNASKEIIIDPSTDKILGYKSLFRFTDQSTRVMRLVDENYMEIFIGETSDTLAVIYNFDYYSSKLSKKYRGSELTVGVLEDLKEDKAIDRIINKNLETCLKKYLMLSSFSQNLIEKTKAKLLLKSLND